MSDGTFSPAQPLSPTPLTPKPTTIPTHSPLLATRGITRSSKGRGRVLGGNCADFLDRYAQWQHSTVRKASHLVDGGGRHSGLV
jgi:hypothetical protein